MKALLLILALTAAAWAQSPQFVPQVYFPWVSGSDTLAGRTADTVQVQQRYTGLNWSSWVQAGVIAVADVTGEVTNVIDITAVSGFSWADDIQLRIFNAGDTLTSGAIALNTAYTSLILFVQPDTLETGTGDTTLVKARLVKF